MTEEPLSEGEGLACKGRGVSSPNPFRAYISTSQTLGQSINAVFEDISGIHEISRQKTKDVESLYTLDGRRAHAKNGSLPKGVYIQGGKKIVIK